jgi:hypothetical protein
MAIKVPRTEYDTLELRDIPYIDWPQLYKDAARHILSSPQQSRVFMETLPGLRQDWLVTKIEAWESFSIDDL